MGPVLRSASRAPERAIREIADDVAREFKLTPDELDAHLASGTNVFLNRVHWASTYLKKAGLLESTGRGRVRITPLGQSALEGAPHRIDRAFLLRYPSFQDFVRPRDATGTAKQLGTAPAASVETTTPQERIDAAVAELRNDLADELLAKVKSSSPRFFERLVIDLLRAMGYGGTRAEASEVLGRTGDAGLDGVIRQDRLGLDAVYVQAKRWDNTVGRPTVQAFAGSLDGVRARKGVLLTTSTFSPEARSYVSEIEKKIVLIDGTELVDLMIEHNIGVSTEATIHSKRVDTDYFEEE
jgi:restriction system protein